jgi:hypothetical protein
MQLINNNGAAVGMSSNELKIIQVLPTLFGHF